MRILRGIGLVLLGVMLGAGGLRGFQVARGASLTIDLNVLRIKRLEASLIGVLDLIDLINPPESSDREDLEADRT